MVIALLIAALIPLAGLYIVWSLEIYAFVRTRTLLLATVWGGLAYGMARLIQTGIIEQGWMTYEQVVIVGAPVMEELLKAAVILLLAHTMRLRYRVDGLAYGFAIGTGFALVENVAYVSASGGGDVGLALARVLSVSLMHAVTTAFTGTVAGGTAHRSVAARVRHLVPALATVILVHGLFNTVALTLDGERLLITGVILGVAGMVHIVYMLHRYLAVEGKAFGDALRTEVSNAEVSAVSDPSRISNQVLAKLKAISPGRARQVEAYVRLQARYGMLQHTYRRNRRPQFQETLAREILHTRQEINELRQEMGLYTWMWLRSVVPSEESDIWEHLGHEVADDQPVLSLIVALVQAQERVPEDDLRLRLHLLQRSGLFAALSQDDLTDLALLLTRCVCAFDHVVTAQNAVNDRLFLVAEGSLIAESVDTGGIRTPVDGYAAYDTFGELSMIHLKPSAVTITCVTPSVLYAMQREDFIALMMAKPQIALAVIGHLVEDINRYTELMRITQSQAEGRQQEHAPVPV